MELKTMVFLIVIPTGLLISGQISGKPDSTSYNAYAFYSECRHFEECQGWVGGGYSYCDLIPDVNCVGLFRSAYLPPPPGADVGYFGGGACPPEYSKCGPRGASYGGHLYEEDDAGSGDSGCGIIGSSLRALHELATSCTPPTSGSSGYCDPSVQCCPSGQSSGGQYCVPYGPATNPAHPTPAGSGTSSCDIFCMTLFSTLGTACGILFCLPGSGLVTCVPGQLACHAIYNIDGMLCQRVYCQ